MKQKELLERCHDLGYLNDKGLNALIGYLKGDIIDIGEKMGLLSKLNLNEGEDERGIHL